MTTLIVYFALANGISFVCSMLEAVILSVSYSHIGLMVKERHRMGKALKAMKDEIDRPLAAILTLATISHTVGAAGVGAQVQVLWGSKALAIGSAVLTLSILIIAEIIPKTLGAAYWRQLAPLAARLIRVLIVITYPIVVLSDLIARVVAPRGVAHRHRVTREEMMMVAEMGESEGELHSRETDVIGNILRLNDIRVKDILTPRSVVCGFQQDRTAEDIVNREAPIFFSRIPAYGEDIDDIKGFVLRNRLYELFATGAGKTPLSALLHPIHVVPTTISVRELLDQFIERKEHIFLVVDEYGGTEGIVTLEDAIETLLGLEIVDEFDNVDDLRHWARELWERRKQEEMREV